MAEQLEQTTAERLAGMAEGYLHGQRAEDGSVSGQDFELAHELAVCAAEKGSSRAFTILGILYQSGGFVLQDMKKAEIYFRKAAEAGDMKAPRYLGLMCEECFGGEAFAWYRLGAERGDITSMYLLGRAYEKGCGTVADLEQAVFWYQKAAQRTDHVGAPAREALARLQTAKRK